MAKENAVTKEKRMDMKKIIAVILILVTILGFTANAKVGDVIGTAYNTDIVAYINNYAIPSYAVNGQSVIVAEDLRNFGFYVNWNDEERSLTISKKLGSQVSEMTVNKFEKSGSKFTDILETDISVYAYAKGNPTKLTSYALNGYTMIPVEELNMFGSVEWVENERSLKLWVDHIEARKTKQMPEKSKIGAPQGVNFCVDGIGFFTNSADGIKAYWSGKNNTGKRINYYTTYFSMYNAVGDPARCTIKHSNVVSQKTVGPVEPGADLIVYSIIAYTGVCSLIRLDRIFVEYSDGTSEWIDYGYVGGETVWDKYNNPTIGLSIYK